MKAPLVRASLVKRSYTKYLALPFTLPFSLVGLITVNNLPHKCRREFKKMIKNKKPYSLKINKTKKSYRHATVLHEWFSRKWVNRKQSP